MFYKTVINWIHTMQQCQIIEHYFPFRIIQLFEMKKANLYTVRVSVLALVYFDNLLLYLITKIYCHRSRPVTRRAPGEAQPPSVKILVPTCQI